MLIILLLFNENSISCKSFKNNTLDLIIMTIHTILNNVKIEKIIAISNIISDSQLIVFNINHTLNPLIENIVGNMSIFNF